MFDFSTSRQAPVLMLEGSHDPLAREGETGHWAMRLHKKGFQAAQNTLHAGHGVTAYDLDQLGKTTVYRLLVFNLSTPKGGKALKDKACA